MRAGTGSAALRRIWPRVAGLTAKGAKGAEFRTARNPERREIPNGAKSRRTELRKGGDSLGSFATYLSTRQDEWSWMISHFAPLRCQMSVDWPSIVRPLGRLSR